MSGFRFADFCGHCVVLVSVNGAAEERLESHEVLYYDNSIQLPIPKEVVDGEPEIAKIAAVKACGTRALCS